MCLSGFDKTMFQPPYATSELGQIRKMMELDAQSGQKGRVYADLLGGPERVRRLDAFFSELNRSCDLCVCSKGLVGPIRVILERCGLLDKFVASAPVYGRISDYEELDFDRETAAADCTWRCPPELRRHVGLLPMADWSQKAALCKKLAAGRRVILVEDDAREIRKAKTAGVDTCYVEKRQGIDAAEMSLLQRWARGEDVGGGTTEEE